jgi:hypothetical protein
MFKDLKKDIKLLKRLLKVSPFALFVFCTVPREWTGSIHINHGIALWWILGLFSASSAVE